MPAESIAPSSRRTSIQNEILASGRKSNTQTAETQTTKQQAPEKVAEKATEKALEKDQSTQGAENAPGKKRQSIQNEILAQGAQQGTTSSTNTGNSNTTQTTTNTSAQTSSSTTTQTSSSALAATQTSTQTSASSQTTEGSNDLRSRVGSLVDQYIARFPEIASYSNEDITGISEGTPISKREELINFYSKNQERADRFTTLVSETA